MSDLNLYPGRRIVCAAIRSSLGTIVCGPRHFDGTMAATIERLTPEFWHLSEQGFIDQKGEFLSREQAWLVAEKAGQIIRRVGGDEEGRLYSENLY